MQTTSTLYKRILNWEHSFESKVTISGNDVTDGIMSMSIERLGLKSNAPGVGGAVSAVLDVKLVEPGFTIPKMAEIVVQTRATNGTEYSEWLTMGTFYIDTREHNKDSSHLSTVTIRAYDKMLMFQKMFPQTTLSFPAKDIDVVNAIAAHVGATVDSRTTALVTKAYLIKNPTLYTMREVLASIAAAYAGNFVISPSGQLLLVPIWGNANAATIDVGTSPRKLEIGRATEQYKYVELDAGFSANGNLAVYTAGTSGALTMYVDMPDGTQAMANNILSALTSRNFAYQPIAAERAIVDPAAEIGDKVTGGGVTTVIHRMTIPFSSAMFISVYAPMDEETLHEYQYEPETVRKIARESQYTRVRLTVNEDSIESEVSRATGAESGLSTRITQNAENITSEVTRAKNAESGLSTRITQNADSISSEVTNRTNADAAMSTRITQNATDITSEVSRAKNAESGLSTRITQNADSISSEVTNRENADSSLSSRITQNANDISSEVTRATDAEGSLSSNISQTEQRIMSVVTQEYYTAEQTDEMIGSVSTSIQQTADGLRIDFTSLQRDLQDVQSAADAKFASLQQYIQISGGTMTFGEVGNEITLTIENDRIGIYSNGVAVTYWTASDFVAPFKLTVPSGGQLILGSFVIAPRANGSLDFNWIGG